MVRAPARADGDGDRSRTDSRSFFSGLLAWLLIGLSLGQLGVAVIEALTVTPGLASTHALLVVLGATVGVALLARDFEPSPLAAFAFYFLAEFFYVVSVLVGRLGLVSGDPIAPWETVGFRALAIGVAGLLVFGGAGMRGVQWLQSRLRTVLDVPPRDPPADEKR